MPGAPGHWSIATGETVSPGRDAVSFELGWPGITAGYLHGINDSTDVGVKFDLLKGNLSLSGALFQITTTNARSANADRRRLPRPGAGGP